MPCLNAGPYLDLAISSVLAEPRVVELLVADGGSIDGSIEIVKHRSQKDHRVQIVSLEDKGPADAVNKLIATARGPLISWLNTDDLYTPGALYRAISWMETNQEWMMAYGEAMHIDQRGAVLERYPTKKPQAGLSGFVDGCYICQPTVIWRSAFHRRLGPLNTALRTAFDMDYWMRAFAEFPSNIGYIPHIQAHSRLHKDTITCRERRLVCVEAISILARYIGNSPHPWLVNYAEELELGLAKLPKGETFRGHLFKTLMQVKSYLEPAIIHELLVCFRDVELRLSRENKTAQRKVHILYRSKELPVTESDSTPKPFGVNLYGDIFAQFGMGEDVRMAGRALLASDIPFAVINIPPHEESVRSKDSFLSQWQIPLTPDVPFAFNLFILTADAFAAHIAADGTAHLAHRYSIAAWDWHLSKWPVHWEGMPSWVNEVWCSSYFSVATLRTAVRSDGPNIQLLPKAVSTETLPIFTGITGARRCFSLPLDICLFCCSYDLDSNIKRVNPRGVLDAFRLAFPSHHRLADKVGLVIKTTRPTALSQLQQVYQLGIQSYCDNRIHIISANHSRHELMSLYGCCDVFVSLHRSEGFNRNLAEALQLGLDVIATDYGGNTDFCKGPLCHPVRYQEVAFQSEDYTHAEGQYWAEPDVLHASRLMQMVAEQRIESGRPVSSVKKPYIKAFSAEQTGARYLKRLKELWPGYIKTYNS